MLKEAFVTAVGLLLGFGDSLVNLVKFG